MWFDSKYHFCSCLQILEHICEMVTYRSNGPTRFTPPVRWHMELSHLLPQTYFSDTKQHHARTVGLKRNRTGVSFQLRLNVTMWRSSGPNMTEAASGNARASCKNWTRRTNKWWFDDSQVWNFHNLWGPHLKTVPPPLWPRPRPRPQQRHHHQQQQQQQQQQTTNNKQQTTNNKQQTTNNKQQKTNNKQHTTNNQQQQQQQQHQQQQQQQQQQQHCCCCCCCFSIFFTCHFFFEVFTFLIFPCLTCPFLFSSLNSLLCWWVM